MVDLVFKTLFFIVLIVLLICSAGQHTSVHLPVFDLPTIGLDWIEQLLSLVVSAALIAAAITIVLCAGMMLGGLVLLVAILLGGTLAFAFVPLLLPIVLLIVVLSALRPRRGTRSNA